MTIIMKKTRKLFRINIIRNIVLLLVVQLIFAFTAFSQRQVTGKITDAKSGEALPGVNVVQKGTTNGTVTNNDGFYSITVGSPDAVLVVSFIGYASQEVELNGRTQVDLNLEISFTQLDEVVAIGYGTVRKRDLTGSVTSVKSEEIREVPTQSPLEAIQGKVAGVDITRSNGSTSSGINIRIRGNRSIAAGNGPLFIIDGVQSSNIDDINPNSIESIEFLKDESSTAIYGWQGANGIVIVTTKKGTGDKMKVDLNAYYGMSQVSRYPATLNGQEYAQIRREAKRTVGVWNSIADDTLIF